MDEFLILLQAKLDEAKSKGNVNADIKELQNQLDKLKVQVEIDPKSLTKIVKQLESTLGQKIKMHNVAMDAKIGQQIGVNIGKNIADGVSKTSGKINTEMQKLVNQVNKIQLSIDGKNVKSKNYDLQIETEIKKLKNLGFTEEEVVQKVRILTDAQADLKRVLGSNDFDSIASKNKAIVESDKERTIALNQVRTAYEQLKNDASQYYNLDKQSKLSTDIQNWLSKNSRASKEAKKSLEDYYRELNGDRVSVDRLDYIEKELKSIDANQRGFGKLGKNLKDQFKEAGYSFTQWLSVSSGIMFGVSKIKDSISELKEIDTLITEISKANDKLSKNDLKNTVNASFDVASKYGKKSINYLSGVQEASRAGYDDAMGIAELSVAAQGAGDMTDELANKYIIATDKAYRLGGSIEKLKEVLDGSNYITNNNAVNMTELAEGMSIVGSTASSFGVEVNETTAALGTMIASTQLSGSEMARAFRAILLNIRQVSDEEENIDAEGLTKYEKACNALGVSLKETKDGVLQTRNAMDVLRDLSVEYNQLEENDLRRTELLNSVGGKLRANALDAILKNYDMYSKMLDEYVQGAGSMDVEAEKTAKSWEGSMNRLSNTWTATVGNIANSDVIIGFINILNNLVSVIDKITSKLGSLGTIGLGVGLFSGLKNFGRDKMYSLIC